MPYLVDGNNLAHALGLLEAGMADRAACARTVRAFCQSHGARATVFFDGPRPEGPEGAMESRWVRMVFGDGRAADDLILQRVRNSKTPRDFIVVTSDKSLGDKARHQGATVERAHEFARRLNRPVGRARVSSDKPTARETPEQIEAWLKLFGGKRD